MIEWAPWVENIEVYRDGPEGSFHCTAWVDDDWVRESGEYTPEFMGWGDTVEEAIRNAIAAGNAAFGEHGT